MGGYGSGRRRRSNAKKTTDEFPTLDIRELTRLGLLGTDRLLRCGWNAEGQGLSAVLVRMKGSSVEVYPLTKNGDGSEEASSPHVISLVQTPCNYGGTRSWFQCPHCFRRVVVLYIAGGLACRNCLQLRYQSQREVDYLRAVRRAKKVNLRLGGDGVVGAAPAKPKGMWWRTYQRLANESHELRVRAWAGVARRLKFPQA